MKEIEAWAVMKKGKFVLMKSVLDLYPYIAVFDSKVAALCADEEVNPHRKNPRVVRVRIIVEDK